MDEESKKIQDDWDLYEKERARRRKDILRELICEIEKDKLLLEEKRKELSKLEYYLEIAESGDIRNDVKEKRKEIKEIKHRIANNREIYMVMDDKGTYDSDGFLDSILDRPFDSHGGIAEGSRVNALPLHGIGLLGILEIRKLFKKWMGKRESE